MLSLSLLKAKLEVLQNDQGVNPCISKRRPTLPEVRACLYLSILQCDNGGFNAEFRRLRARSATELRCAWMQRRSVGASVLLGSNDLRSVLAVEAEAVGQA